MKRFTIKRLIVITTTLVQLYDLLIDDLFAHILALLQNADDYTLSAGQIAWSIISIVFAAWRVCAWYSRRRAKAAKQPVAGTAKPLSRLNRLVASNLLWANLVLVTFTLSLHKDKAISNLTRVGVT